MMPLMNRAGFIPPSRINFSVDTVTSSTGTYVRLKFGIDTINVGEVLKIQYKITAALYQFPPTGSKLMRLNNYQTDVWFDNLTITPL